MNFKTLTVDTLADGAALSATTVLAMMAASQSECGSPWAAINPTCHILDGDGENYPDTYSGKDSLRGLALCSSAMFAWAGIHNFLFGRVRGPLAVAAGGATAALAYIVDYHVVPPRYTPGLEQKISAKSIAWIYVVLGLTLGLTSFARKHS